jgi:hypothetical protein
MTSIKLFSVKTMLDSIITRGLLFKNVEVTWLYRYRGEHRRQHMYADLIEGYDPTDRLVSMPEGCVEESFTEDEAKILKVYLDEHLDEYCSHPTTVKEVKLPISMNTISWSCFPCRPGFSDYIELPGPTHTLPFPVNWGFFDLEDRLDEAKRPEEKDGAATLSRGGYEIKMLCTTIPATPK